MEAEDGQKTPPPMKRLPKFVFPNTFGDLGAGWSRTRAECVHCGHTYDAVKVDHWCHLRIHVNSTKPKFGTQEFAEIPDPTDETGEKLLFKYEKPPAIGEKLPWYMHSVYQDRSASPPQYPMDFTDLVWLEDEAFELERRIKHPFSTHVWLQEKPKKTGDEVRDYFALSVRDARLDKSVSRCPYCKTMFPFRPLLVQTALAMCLHVLDQHPDKRTVCAAAKEDILAVQEATGLVAHRSKCPDYETVFLVDLLPDPLFIVDVLGETRTEHSFYCAFCFHRNLYKQKLSSSFYLSIQYAKHLESHHKISVEYSKPLVCLDEHRIGRPVPTSYYSFYLPLLIIRSADHTRFSWNCFRCDRVMSEAEPISLLFQALIHTYTSSKECPLTGLPHGAQINTHKHLNEAMGPFVRRLLDTKKASMMSQNTVHSLKAADSLRFFAHLPLKELGDWFDPMAFVAAGRRPKGWSSRHKFKGAVDVLEPLTKAKGSRLFICPHCLRHFTDKAAVFLHLTPNQCHAPSAVSFHLDREDVAKLQGSSSSGGLKSEEAVKQGAEAMETSGSGRPVECELSSSDESEDSAMIVDT